MADRDYQIAAELSAFKEWENGARSTLVVLPTGCVSGDTIIGMHRAGKGYSRTIEKAYKLRNDGRVDHSITTKVRSLVGDRIGLNPCSGISFSGIRETYTLKLMNGKSIRATADHEVLTKYGYVPLARLVAGNLVVVETDVIPKNFRIRINYSQVQGLRFHPYRGGARSASDISESNPTGVMYRVPYHRLVAEAKANDVSVDEFIKICRIGPVPGDFVFFDPEVFAVHHKNRDPKDNSPGNLEVITHIEHQRIHGYDNCYNFGYGVPNVSEVVSVEFNRPEPTYDVICDGAHRNFVANGIVVHNSGKTVVATRIIKRIQPKKTLFIAHREELIWQARERIQEHTGLESDIEMGELVASRNLFGSKQVVIATVQTLNSKNGLMKRMGKFKPEEFGLLIVDESHHIVCDTYRNIVNYFGQNKDLKILCLTATPDRADELALGQMVETVAFDYEILDAIKDGWLVGVEQQMVNINSLDFSHVRTTAGDLNGADLAAVMETEENMQGVAGASINIIGSRRSIVFTASVKQAEIVSDIFNRHREGMAAWVCGETPKERRRELLSKFKSGETQVMCNCGVLTEGFDSPEVEVIIMARPTKSRSLYAQMAGRSLRPLPGIVDDLPDAQARLDVIAESPKPNALIVDFVGNSGRHKLMTSADILGGKVSDQACERALKLAEKLGKPVNMVEALEEAEEEIKSEIEARRREEEARKARLVAKVKFSSRKVNPFDAFDMEPVKERGWDQGKVLSEKQRQLLMKQGIDPTDMPYAQGRQLIQEFFRRWNNGLCSVKQAALLKKHGYETSNIKRDEASKLIDALAKNGWRRPAAPQPESSSVVEGESFENSVPF